MAASAPSVLLKNHTDALVRKSLLFAEEHLSHLPRSSGESYAKHGLEVALALHEATTEPSLIAVAILHDILLHKEGDTLLKKSPLDTDGRSLVKRMHELRGLHIDMSTRDLDRVLHAFSGDPRMLLLRTAHRLNDVRHLERFAKSRQKEIAHETLYMYTAISSSLGFHQWRWQMEDICFRMLEPRLANRLQSLAHTVEKDDKACLSQSRKYLQRKLRTHGISASIDERIKGIYSTYRKMVLKDRSFEEVMDRLALRILVPTIDDCYRALGVVHSTMRPVHGKLKDYIGTPKENGYRSIHTVVYPLPGVSTMPIEIQIRTHDMHRECEFGVASHDTYKQLGYRISSPRSRVTMMRNLENLHDVVRTHRGFSHALKRSFSEEHVIVFDPKNNVHYLPRGANGYDYLKLMGEKTKTLRINGREQHAHSSLKDGDTVEIIQKNNI